ncbi:flavin reductase family protein [Oharaeibacter diazotrophicus]|uniref:Flavin reductase (DIM6/NTAB) family NADH-FMN oxidoreductase RutF n=1 Tax=Oharaeibacter diazotrophicus TaxID=1920512 RepID=A0A4R6RGC4_9HYPH|nr:flavin reductase family protein [Oharaeibacter diazotrophicus]TDP85419.1 flavin reductase (DIM6/NTAB) family NADH-FMN oxidoreductase RutF [Oharaeibacter diazotrophicus]BBE74389.1 4-nitrophenol 4-monooxygenase/4-nitrocatechol 2-monooxygenase, reductase component [Pleomorphomonas sp. SM30]GLS75915.1 flavin reductase [Oharaeibacter diazotrophicus]
MTVPNPMTDAFREAFRRHPAGVAVITADPGERPVAMTVSSLISVAAAPPVVAFSLSTRSGSSEPLLRAETMVIHLLRFSDIDLAQLCATPGAERFGTAAPWERLPTGEPRYTAVATWFRARRLGTLPIDGATLVAAELLDGEVRPGDDPPEAHSLVYLDRRWHRLHKELEGAISLFDHSHFV